MTESEPIILLLCGRLLALIIEIENLKLLVSDMLFNVPENQMGTDQRALLADAKANWGR